MTDLTDYIGIPFKYGGRTTKELDCYGLVMLLYKNLKNVDIPDVTSPSILEEIASLVTEEKRKWVASPIEEGAVLIFSIRGYGAHVGYVTGPDTMIHTWEETNGVTIERISLSWKHRILGCYKYED